MKEKMLEGKVLGVSNGAVRDPERKKHVTRFEKENPLGELFSFEVPIWILTVFR